MTAASTSADRRASGLVRATVASGTRCVDLVLPGAVPVAELLPELARSVGLLDATTAHRGYRLVTPGGRVLSGDTGLVAQGVADGGLLTVVAGVDDEPPPAYDDVVEAMTDVVERDLEHWGPASGRRACLCAAGLLMALGAVALVTEGSSRATVAAAVVAVGLLGGAVVTSRALHQAATALAVAGTGCLYAAASGFLLAPPGSQALALPTAAAGAGLVVAGLVAVVGLGRGRSLAILPIVIGVVLLATGLVAEVVGLGPAPVLTSALAVVVLIAGGFPWLALSATSTRADQLCSSDDLTFEPAEVDAARVGADARVAHEILVAMSAAVGLLLVLVVPLAVSRGVAGTLLAVACSLVVMLRTRQHRAGVEVLVGLVSGVLGLAAVAASVLWLHPGWRPAAAAVLAVSGAVLLVLTVVHSTPSVRRRRFADLAESMALLSLLPLLVLTTGAASAVVART